jgi:hypothetical protein
VGTEKARGASNKNSHEILLNYIFGENHLLKIKIISNQFGWSIHLR